MFNITPNPTDEKQLKKDFVFASDLDDLEVRVAEWISDNPMRKIEIVVPTGMGGVYCANIFYA